MKRSILIIVLLFVLSGCRDNQEVTDDPVDSPIDACELHPDSEACELDDDPVDPSNDECELFPFSEACQSSTEDTYSITSYASDIQFSVSKVEVTSFNTEEYFEIDIDSVSYSPIQKEVCVYFTATDTDYQHASYYMLLQDTDRYLTRQQIQLGSAGEVFSNGDCMDIDDSSLDYRIIIGKIDTDSFSFDPFIVEASAVIRFRDSHKSSRKHVSIQNYSDLTPDMINEIGSSFLKTQLKILDAEIAITKVRILVEDSKGTDVIDKEVNASDIRGNNVLTILEEVTDLAPKSRYKFTVYISGNDGYDDFSDVILFQKTIEAAPIERWQFVHDGELDVYHDLYAYVYDIEQNEEDIIIHYYYHNDNTMLNSELDPLKLSMVLFDESDSYYSSYSLEAGEHSISIPFTDLSSDFSIEIQDLETSNLYDYFSLPTFEPQITLFRDHNHMRADIIKDYNNIISVNFKVYVSGYATIIEEFDFDDIYQNSSFTLYHDFDEIDFYIEITIRYYAYGEVQLTQDRD